MLHSDMVVPGVCQKRIRPRAESSEPVFTAAILDQECAMQIRDDQVTSPKYDASATWGVTDPGAQQLAWMIRGYWISQIVGTLAQLGIPDYLAHGPMEVGEIARLIACDA